VFFMVRTINRIKREDAAPAAPTTKKCPMCAMDIPIAAKRCPHCTSEVA
jgi:large conductance mechanosensitive channel